MMLCQDSGLNRPGGLAWPTAAMFYHIRDLFDITLPLFAVRAHQDMLTLLT